MEKAITLLHLRSGAKYHTKVEDSASTCTALVHRWCHGGDLGDWEIGEAGGMREDDSRITSNDTYNHIITTQGDSRVIQHLFIRRLGGNFGFRCALLDVCVRALPRKLNTCTFLSLCRGGTG